MNLEEKIEKAEEHKRYFIGKLTVLEIAMNYQKEQKTDFKNLIRVVEELNLKEGKLFDKELKSLRVFLKTMNKKLKALFINKESFFLE